MIIALAGQIPVTNTRKTPSKEVRDPSGTPPKNEYHQDSLRLEYKEVHYFDIIHVYSSLTQTYIC